MDLLNDQEEGPTGFGDWMCQCHKDSMNMKNISNFWFQLEDVNIFQYSHKNQRICEISNTLLGMTETQLIAAISKYKERDP